MNNNKKSKTSHDSIGHASPQADPVVLYVMMKHYRDEAQEWERIARRNEIDNAKKDMELQVLEAVNATHLAGLQDANATIHHLWRRNDILYATLTEIARNNPELQQQYMPWMTAVTPPMSPIDLTTDEELEDL